MDVNELHQALVITVPDLNKNHTEILMRSYDRNSDGKINFKEFNRLNLMLNELYNLFLDHVEDSNGKIGLKELKLLLLKKHYDLSDWFFDTILSENYQDKALSFNDFIFFYGRLGFLKKLFQKSNQICFETFVINNFKI